MSGESVKPGRYLLPVEITQTLVDEAASAADRIVYVYQWPDGARRTAFCDPADLIKADAPNGVVVGAADLRVLLTDWEKSASCAFEDVELARIDVAVERIREALQ